MAQQAVRDYLRNRGLKDEQITYDNGAVMANGKRFMDATPQADGRTYADSRALDSAYNNYDTTNQIADLRTRATTPNPEQTAMQQALRERINRPVQQFSYDQNSDPAYQNALRSAQANAATAQNNTLANLRARGQGKSSYSEAVANQIQQKEMGRVTSDVLPQLINQAYQRYAGQQQLENQQLGNMFNLANMNDNQDARQYSQLAQALGLQQGYNQQQFQNDRAMTAEERQRQQDHIGLADRLTQMYGKTVNPTEDPSQSYAQVDGLTPLAMQQYLQQKAMQEAGLTGNYNGAPTMQREGMSFDQGLRNKQLGLEQQRVGISQQQANRTNVTQQRYDQQQAQSGYEGQVADIFAEAQSEQDVNDLLSANKADIVKNLGTAKYEQIKNSALAPYQQSKKDQAASDKQSQQQQQDFNSKALQLAQGDPQWKYATPELKKNIIDSYKQLLQAQ